MKNKVLGARKLCFKKICFHVMSYHFNHLCMMCKIIHHHWFFLADSLPSCISVTFPIFQVNFEVVLQLSLGNNLTWHNTQNFFKRGEKVDFILSLAEKIAFFHQRIKEIQWCPTISFKENESFNFSAILRKKVMLSSKRASSSFTEWKMIRFQIWQTSFHNYK